jgi:hypothetical protein
MGSLQPGTVLCFGSLEFMSLDDSYDMALLPRNATATTTVVSSPGGGELDDVFPPWRKSSIRVCLTTLLAAEGGDGATVAMQEAAPHRLSSESTTPAPQWGTRRALSSHLRQRRMSFPRNVPTPSGLMTPALSRRTC